MKKIRLLVLFIIVSSIFLGTVASAQNRYYFRTGMFWNSLNVSNLSEDFRNVPKHKDDKGGSTGIIQQETYNIPWYFSVGYRFVHRYENDMALGYDLMFVIPQGNFARRNYTNKPGTDQRGYGAALTFAGTTILGPINSLTGLKPIVPGISIAPGIFVEAPIWCKYEKTQLKLNLALSYQTLSAISGWDRYDKLQSYDTQVLAHLLPIDLALKLHFLRTDFEFGTRFNLSVPTKAGKKANLDISKTGFFITASLGS
jgi:hypothetical protein